MQYTCFRAFGELSFMVIVYHARQRDFAAGERGMPEWANRV